jgi:pimeloyl-ACP methyl ester carboxylesterase
VPSFTHDDQRLSYSSYGEGKRVFVLLHGQLLNQRMHEPLAHALARAGHRVVTIDLLGHGDSARPREMWRYSMGQYAEQVVALLDHLDVDQAVIGGTSLGANVTLEFAVLAPERARGLVVEMPVLDEGIFAAVVSFTPLLATFKFGQPLVRLMGWLAQPIPRGPLPLLARIALDAIRQDHSASAEILQGLFLGRIAPNHVARQAIELPTLVIGHAGDPVHPLADAAELSNELPNGRLVEANNILEMRLHPERLTTEISTFLDACWRPQRSRARTSRRKKAS